MLSAISLLAVLSDASAMSCTRVVKTARVDVDGERGAGQSFSSYECSRSGGGSRGDTRPLHDNGGGGGRPGGEKRRKNPGENNTQNLQASENCPVEGNPVTLATGNKIESETDFGTAGEMALHLERTYNQFTDATGLFGYSWISNFDYKLSFGGSSTYSGCYARPSIVECTTGHQHDVIFAHRPDGRIIKFTKNATTGIYWENKPDPISKLVRQGDGKWLITFEDNLTELYTQGGYALWLQDEHGLRWTYTYGGMNNTQVQRVTHSNGRYVQFVWVDDELREVRDPAGTPYQFAYTNQKDAVGFHTLQTTTYPGPNSTVIGYHYGGAEYPFGALTGKSYNGVRYSTFTYDLGQRATSTAHAGGVEHNTFAYAAPATGELSVTHTSPLGKETIYDFKDGRLLTVTGQLSTYCAATGRSNTYDANGYPDLVTNENGNVANYDYNAKGQLLKKVEAQGTPEARSTLYAWDAAKNRITEVTVVGHRRTNYAFHADNRLASITVTNLTANGVANQTRATTYTYTKHANGLLATMAIDGPLPSDTVTSTYSSTGDLLSISNGLGHVTNYSNYNALGLPGRVVGINGAATEFTYDPRGRTTAVSNIVANVAQTTLYTFDSAGRLATIKTPDNVTSTREYDAANRLLREYQDEAGGTFAVKKYTYNNASQATSVTVQRTTAISPPTGTPTLSISSNSAGNYTVAWSGASGVENYVLEEKLNSGAWTSSNEGSSTSKAYVSKPAGTYTYRVTGCNAEACTPVSAEKSIGVLYPPASTPALTAPTADSDGAFTISWTSVSTATHYQLLQKKDSGTWSTVYNGSNLSMAASGLANGNYQHVVRACNAGGCADYSASKATLVTHPPGTPTVTAPSTDNDGAFAVSWGSVSTATDYRLEQRKDGSAWSQIYSGTGLSHSISGLTNGTYDYRARACNAGGCSAYSAIRTTVVTHVPDSAPTLTAPISSDTYTSYTVSWTTVSGATAYELQKAFNDGIWETAYYGSANSASQSQAYDGKYSYRVVACNVSGCGPFSATVNVHVAGGSGGGGTQPLQVDPAEEEIR
ncbi:MAG: DUF6531 domain-containing protein [Pseudomonadota bacterium]|nr:DUF6531 domain-containing protein [Pseudomonadota bacterium]